MKRERTYVGNRISEWVDLYDEHLKDDLGIEDEDMRVIVIDSFINNQDTVVSVEVPTDEEVLDFIEERQEEDEV